MRTPQRRNLVGVTERLLAEPQRFSFFQAVRLLERWHAQAAGTPREQVLGRHVHFRNSLALSFPPSEIEHLQALPAPRSADGAEQQGTALPPDVELTPAFFGLLGVTGALPLFYTELLAQRELHHKDTAARAFLDVFQQRAASLLYEAWRKHRLALQYEEDRRRHFLPLVLALTGLGPESLRRSPGHGASPVSDEAIAFFAGTFQQRNRSALQVQRVLSQHFGVPIRVEQFVGRWQPLPAHAQTQLGLSGTLGGAAIVGARVWQRDLRLRVIVGPLSRDAFEHFLPQGRSAAALRELLLMLCGATLEYEVQLQLCAEAAQPIVLGDETVGARLGWDGWLHSSPPAAPLNDSRYELHAAA